jgi:hypothetical protein
VRAEVVEADDDPAIGLKARPTPPPLPAHRRPGDRHPKPARRDEDDESAAYDVHEPAAVPQETVPPELVKPRADELRLLSRDDAPRKPKRAWGPELLAFLGQTGTISALIIASGLCLVVGVFVRVARDFNPLD